MRNKKNVLFLIIAIIPVLLIVAFAVVRYISIDNGMPWKIQENFIAYTLFAEDQAESVGVELDIYRKYSTGEAKWRGTIVFEGVSYEVQNIGHEKERGFDIIGYTWFNDGKAEDSLRIYMWNDNGQMFYGVDWFQDGEYKVYFGPSDSGEEAETIFNKLTTPK